MYALSSAVSYVDLDFQGFPGVIATGVMTDPSGVTLVDPGPTSCLETLRRGLADAGIAIADIRHILLTHIHLDHAGVTGTLVQQNPAIDVYLHERGARHLVDPARLIDSASRLYGTSMGPLWGAILPVPADRVTALRGGERLRVGSREFDVAYTPGHASHHVSYLDGRIGLAWVGDTAGVCVGESRFVLPPTPPPDVDLEAWDASLARIRAWGPSRAFLTHFGPVEPVGELLDDLAVKLREAADMVRRSFDAGPAEAEQFAAFREDFGRYVRRFLSEPDARIYERAAPLHNNWLGLVRYLGTRPS
jgi:glyoxylase-like metal-dependent hydrolase (beta-lactamase superfamily II)